jgi:imidazolonepropionase-like amidohydrolase
MRSGIIIRFACVLTLGAGVRLHGEPPPVFAIRNAKIVRVSGPVMEKGTVVVRDGLIAEVGEAVTPPAGAFVFDGAGMTVYPGLIDAISGWGIPETSTPAASAGGSGRGGGQPPALQIPQQAQTQAPRAQGPEDRPQTQSWVRAADLVRPTDRRLDAARTAGFTTAVTFPKQGIIAGHGAVVNLGGERAGDMVVHPSAGLYLALPSGGRGEGGGGGGFPSSLFGVMAYLRQVWIDAGWYREAQARYQRGAAGAKRPPYDRALEGVLDAPRSLLPATTAVQIDRMARFAKELATPMILYGVHDGYRTAELLKSAGLPVIVSLRWPVRARDADPEDEETLRTLELRTNAPSTPAALVKAGVPFAFSADGVESPREALRAVKKAIDAGLTKEQALRALTLSAAEIYGVADRLGSIDKGKIANLVLVKGDLFEDRPQVQRIFVDGIAYDPQPDSASPAGGAGGRGGFGSTPPPQEEDR